MSYPGNITAEGPFLQGLSSSDAQDTWASNLISYSATNNVATLDSGYQGDWKLMPSHTSPSGTGRYESRKPYSSTTTFALHGVIITYDSGARLCGDESLVAVDSTNCGYYLHQAFNSGTLSPDYSHWSTLCELTP